MEIKEINLETLSEGEIKEWDEILAKSREATIFHTIEWNKILTDVFGVKNHTLVAKRDGQLVGMLVFHEVLDSGPRTIYRSPLTNLETVYGGPMVISGLNDEPVVRKRLIQKMELCAEAVMAGICIPPGINPIFLEELGYVCIPVYTSILSLEKSEENLFGSIHPYARNRIRKAEKSGVQILKDGRPYLSEYYEMVKETLGPREVEVKPKRFYEEVLDRLEPMGRAKLFIAMYKGKPVSGAIFLFYKESAYYWHGASFKEYLPIAPTQLIHWELIRYAHQTGYKSYDFLNIEPERLPGIARFKMRFGGETKTYYRATYATPYLRLPLLRYYITHPSYTLGRLKTRLGKLTNESDCKRAPFPSANQSAE
jgi:hypothetical protein